GHGIGIAHAEAYLLPRIVTELMHCGRKRRVASFDRHQHLRVRLDGSARVVTVQRASLVEHMHQGPEERKERKVLSLQPQLLDAMKHLAIDTYFGKQEIQP